MLLIYIWEIFIFCKIYLLKNLRKYKYNASRLSLIFAIEYYSIAATVNANLSS